MERWLKARQFVRDMLCYCTDCCLKVVLTCVIPGTGNGALHAWNIAELNGVYYNLDSTWDAGKDLYGYFLCSENDF